MNINITIFDYSNSQSLTGYALEACPFTFIPDATISSSYQVLWDFGDGTTSTNISATHFYQNEGVYSINLSIIDTNGNAYKNTFIPVLSVYNFIDNRLKINKTSTPIYNITAGSIGLPIVVSRYNSWQYKQDVYTLIPYLSGAQSNYLDVTQYNSDAWSHLNCYNKFFTKDVSNGNIQYTPTNYYNTTDTNLYAIVSGGSIVNCLSTVPNSFFVGSSGYAAIYFTSDIPKNYDSLSEPVILFVSQDYSAFQQSTDKDMLQYINTQPAVLPNIKIRNNAVTQLSFSSNGLDTEGDAILSSFNIPVISWQNVPIPFIVKLKDKNFFSTKFYPVLSSNNENQTYTASAYNISTYLMDRDNQIISDAKFYTDYIPNSNLSVGGYFKGYLTYDGSLSDCYLSATLYIQNTESVNWDTIGASFYNPTNQAIYSCIYNLNYTSRFEELSSISSNREVITSLSSVFSNTAILSSIPPLYISPITDGAYRKLGIWMIDENRHTIYCVDILGNIVHNVSLSSVYYQSSLTNFISSNELEVTNSYVNFTTNNGITGLDTKYCGALDSNNNLWVSLFGTGKVVRYNPQLKYIDATLSPFNDSTNINTGILALSAYTNQTPVTATTEWTNFTSATVSAIPVSLDVDQNNCPWVGYILPNDSYKTSVVVHYTSGGEINNTIFLPQLSVPRQILIDSFNNVNIVIDYYDGVNMTIVQKYSNSGDLIGGMGISTGSIPTLSAENFVVSLVGDGVYVDTQFDQLYLFSKAGYQLGIPVDSLGTTQIFSDTYNRTHYYNTNTNTISAASNGIASHIYNINTVYSGISSLLPYRGDINAFNFINKFYHTNSEITSIEGRSTPFNIYPQTGTQYIAKKNEDFDANAFYNSLRLQESLSDKDVFFNQVLGTITGNISSEYNSLGKSIYEKIANFVDNNSDVNTSNIQSLLSQCREFSTQYENINYNFPPDLQKLVDLLSINLCHLRGSPNQYGLNFDNQKYISPRLGINLGEKINVFTDILYSYEKIVAYEKYSGKYKLVQSAQQANLEGYALLDDDGNTITNELSSIILFSTDTNYFSSFSPNWGWGLVLPPAVSGTDIHLYYDFYRYVGATDNIYYDNVINWNDSLTTYSVFLSTYTDWTSEDGIMDQVISRGLIKGLNLFP